MAFLDHGGGHSRDFCPVVAALASVRGDERMKKYGILLFTVLLSVLLCMSVSAESAAPRLADEADILTKTEESELILLLDEISERQRVDVVVHTVQSIGTDSVQDAADNLFERCGYGMGEDRSCILLLISMEARDWHITTAGYGITAATKVGIAYIEENMVPYLSDGAYAEAFSTYAEICDRFITMAKSGNPFDADDLPKEPFPVLRNLIVCLGIGMIVGWIAVGKMKAKLISVRRRSEATEYTKHGSMHVTESKDIFLYRTVSKTEKSDSSTEKSETHQTSSGTTVGGNGGKF